MSVAAALRVAVAVALLAVAGAAVALPDGGERRRGPQPLLARASGPLVHSNSRAGQAVVAAADLAPGDSRSGAVTIANGGDGGALYLVARGPVDAPGTVRLSERLDMTIADGSRELASGPLHALPRCLALGELAAGERRTYRFTVAFRRGGEDNAYAGASARVDFEWLAIAGARDACGPVAALEPAGQPATIAVGDTRIAIERGPYRFARRTGAAAVGIRCAASPTGICSGRLALERRAPGQGRGIALAVGTFRVPAGRSASVRIALNPRARRRIRSTGVVAVRAYVTARDAHGRVHRAAYRDRLVYGRRPPRR